MKSITREKKLELLYELKNFLIKIVILFIFLFFMFFIVFGVYRNSDDTMYPSVREGDVVFYFRIDKSANIGDIFLLSVDGEKQVRRVVATEGDVVDISEDGLEINGYLQTGLESTYIFEETTQFVGGIDFPYTVKKNSVFVLADSREESMDSRMYGSVSEKNVIGKVMTLLRIRRF